MTSYLHDMKTNFDNSVLVMEPWSFLLLLLGFHDMHNIMEIVIIHAYIYSMYIYLVMY